MLEPVRGPMAGPPLPGFRCFAGGVEAAAVDADRARLPIAGGATAAAAEGSTAEERRGAAAGLGERDAVVGDEGWEKREAGMERCVRGEREWRPTSSGEESEQQGRTVAAGWLLQRLR